MWLLPELSPPPPPARLPGNAALYFTFAVLLSTLLWLTVESYTDMCNAYAVIRGGSLQQSEGKAGCCLDSVLEVGGAYLTSPSPFTESAFFVFFCIYC